MNTPSAPANRACASLSRPRSGARPRGPRRSVPPPPARLLSTTSPLTLAYPLSVIQRSPRRLFKLSLYDVQTTGPVVTAPPGNIPNGCRQGGWDPGTVTSPRKPNLALGGLPVAPPVVLAPMAGITNVAFRQLCREHGAGVYVCEMVMTRALVERNEKTLRMVTFAGDEKPRSLQLYGVD